MNRFALIRVDTCTLQSIPKAIWCLWATHAMERSRFGTVCGIFLHTLVGKRLILALLVRYTGVDKAPTQYLDGHCELRYMGIDKFCYLLAALSVAKRVIVAKFDQSRGKESLISVSHDNTLMFMDYHMRRNATPDYPLRAC